MKKLLLLSAVVALLGSVNPGRAADLSVKAPPPIPVPIFTWTGFYLGANIGGAWAQRNITDIFGNNFNQSSSGRFIGGGQLGYNWQTGNFVLGIEGDIDGVVSNNNTVGVPTLVAVPPAVFGPFLVSPSNSGWVGTLAARLGFAADHWLFYAKGGGGWVGSSNGGAITNLATGLTLAGNGGGSLSGWLAGGGVEYAITNNWTLKAEYDYIGLGNGNRAILVPLTPVLFDQFRINNRSFQMVKFGFNYLFH